MVWDVVWDTSLDILKLLPFLFVTYLALEFLEHKMGEMKRGDRWERGAPAGRSRGIGGAGDLPPACGEMAAGQGPRPVPQYPALRHGVAGKAEQKDKQEHGGRQC